MAKKLNSNSVAALKKVKTKKPIFVEPGDPRIRMYEDSLALHNAFEGTNPIEIDKNFRKKIMTQNGQKTPKPTPKSNFAPLQEGPYGSKINPAVVLKNAPQEDGLMSSGTGTYKENEKQKSLNSLYAALANFQKGSNSTSQLAGVASYNSPLANLIAEDLYRANQKLPREFAPIGYKTSELMSPNFINSIYETDANHTKTVPPKTIPIENTVEAKEVRKIFPKISDKDLSALITLSQKYPTKAIVKNGKIEPSDLGYIEEKNTYAPRKTAFVTPVYAAPEQPYIAKTPLPKRVPAIVPGLITPKTVPVPVTTPTEPVRVPVEVPVVPNDIVVPEEKIPVTPPVVRKPPKAIMPTRQGGWSKQPLLMRLFPKLYMK